MSQDHDRNIAFCVKVFLQIIFDNKWGGMFFQILIFSFPMKDPTSVQYPKEDLALQTAKCLSHCLLHCLSYFTYLPAVNKWI